MSPAMRLVRVVSGARSHGRCRECRHDVEWATTSNGKSIPLNLGAFILRQEIIGRVRYDVIEPTSVHFNTCTRRVHRQGASR